MIKDNRLDEDVGDNNYTHPLIIYFKDSYSLYGNILTELCSTHTRSIIEIPYICLDSGILFKLWFYERIRTLFSDAMGYKFFIDDNAIKHEVLVKENTSSLIVQTDTKTLCHMDRGVYHSTGNGTFRYTINFTESLPIEVCSLLEDLFYTCTKQFKTLALTIK